MANGYKVTINSIATDGTNIYLTATVDDGAHASPPISPVFAVGTTQTEIDTYMQNIANNGSSLAREIVELVGKTYTGA